MKIIGTKVHVLILHRKTLKAYTYNQKYEILEPLIVNLPEIPKFKTVRQFWRPALLEVPRWSWGVRDTDFDTYFL